MSQAEQPEQPTQPEPREATDPADEPARVHLHLPIDIRNAALVTLAVLACIYTLHWASAVFIPLMLGLMLSYAFSPIVDRLERWHVPRALGAGVLVTSLVGGVGWMTYSLSDDAAALLETLPTAAQKLRLALRASQGGPSSTSAIDKVQKAAAELERAAEESSSALPNPRGVTRVVIERPRFNIKDYLWSSTLGLITAVGQAVVVVLLAYFLLASGDTFRRKMAKLAGPRLSQKRITVEALDEITAQIKLYLLVQVVTSAIVGVATWLAFLWIGLEHAAVWGVVAGVTNLIPYIGAVIVGAGSALVGFMQFGTIQMALLVGGSSFMIHSIVGYLLTPWLTSRASRMNAVTVFVGVLAWGWLWGLWGLLLGVPILMAVKAVCDRVEDLKPVGELLGS
jgi:predicted PurR-regulated permease PerM